MSVKRTDRQASARGFTLAEMVVVIVLLGILAVVVLPRFDTKDFSDALFRDQLVSVLGEARKAATARRRLVCAAIQPRTVSLSVATAAGVACTAPLQLASGEATLASKDATISISQAPLVLYFQPDGRITQDVAGTSLYNGNLSVNAASLTIVGVTGYVR